MYVIAYTEKCGEKYVCAHKATLSLAAYANIVHVTQITCHVETSNYGAGRLFEIYETCFQNNSFSRERKNICLAPNWRNRF